MTGLSQFLELFGNVTLAQVVMVIFAGVFLLVIGKKICSVIIERHDAARLRDAQVKEALDSVRKYPEYRQQSVEIQQRMEDEIGSLHDSYKRVEDQLVEITSRLQEMEERMDLRDRNKLRDLLLQNYRHYTNTKTNPSGTWTRMEADAFWALFHDYEDAGGDGFMHTVVQPAMEKLVIVEVYSEHS